jgi:hypothetical protein
MIENDVRLGQNCKGQAGIGLSTFLWICSLTESSGIAGLQCTVNAAAVLRLFSD